MKCDICDKEVDQDYIRCFRNILEKIKYKIPTSFIKGEKGMIDISDKIKGKDSIIVGKYCRCNKRINIALKKYKA